jgi:hypothetical protein
LLEEEAFKSIEEEAFDSLPEEGRGERDTKRDEVGVDISLASDELEVFTRA